MAKIFESVPRSRPERNVFDLSYTHKFTCDAGQLIPAGWKRCIPGDVFNIGGEAFIRAAPMVAPLLHRVDGRLDWFFVPDRIAGDLCGGNAVVSGSDMESFITGGVDGTDSQTLSTNAGPFTEGRVADYLGLPIGITLTGVEPWVILERVYAGIFNTYYRDETQVSEINGAANQVVQTAPWKKDYFTSALPWQLRGVAPAIPVTGNLDSSAAVGYSAAAFAVDLDSSVDKLTGGSSGSLDSNLVTALDKIELDAVAADVAELRMVVQMQRFMERTARTGARYTEFLRGAFGVAPQDQRLDRPEFIGRMKFPLVFSEVLQTSASDLALESGGSATPQGNLAGHGVGVAMEHIGRYRVEEFGTLMCIFSIMPEPDYEAQGVPRELTISDRYDLPFPEFVHLSEQPILNGELVAKTADATHNQTIFGYQGRFDEYRHSRNLVTGGFRTNSTPALEYWHWARYFAPGSEPDLDDAFIEFDGKKTMFAASSEPGFYVNLGHHIRALRPLPAFGVPGMLDH